MSTNEKITVNKKSLEGVISLYIGELEDQDVVHMEIVSILLDLFTREELESLGFGEFIEDCFSDEEEEKN